MSRSYSPDFAKERRSIFVISSQVCILKLNLAEKSQNQDFRIFTFSTANDRHAVIPRGGRKIRISAVLMSSVGTGGGRESGEAGEGFRHVIKILRVPFRGLCQVGAASSGRKEIL